METTMTAGSLARSASPFLLRLYPKREVHLEQFHPHTLDLPGFLGPNATRLAMDKAYLFDDKASLAGFPQYMVPPGTEIVSGGGA